MQTLETRMLLVGEPVITGVVPLPGNGGQVSAAIDQLNVQLSEPLQAATANDIGNWQLLGAGDDGTLDTADDVTHSLSLASPYVDGDSLSLNIDGRLAVLQEGAYRFTALAGLLDLDGNALDGNQDGTGGDPFVTTFLVDAAPGDSIETLSNDSREFADPLDMLVTPNDSGYARGFGLGAIQEPGDIDYWWFEALAGDVVAISVDTPDSNINPFVSLRNSADGSLNTDDNSGPNNDAFISTFRIESSGRYNVRVGAHSGGTGPYEVRVDVVSNPTQLETDGNDANDSVAGADAVRKRPLAGTAVATVAGTIMEATGTNTDEDIFSVGQFNVGNQVSLDLRYPDGSTLDGAVVLLDSSGTPVADDDGISTDSDFTTTITAADNYYVRVTGNSGAGNQAQYLLDLAVVDNVSPQVRWLDDVPGSRSVTPWPTAEIRIQFDEDLNPNSFTTGAFDLRQSGDDGTFGTADDEVFTLANAPAYTRGGGVVFSIRDGEMTAGDYRLTVAGTVTDVAGNAIDGNGDGTGGDAFVHDFTLDLSADFTAVFESEGNETQAEANTLTPFNGGVPGLTSGFGLGVLDNSSDIDYWKFRGQAGDQLMAYTSTLTSGLNTRLTLYNPAGQYLTENSFSGANDDDYISGYTLPSDGEYFLLVNRRSGGTRGDYELHVHTVRNADAETDADYNNDALTNADTLSFSDTPTGRTATAVGLVMPIEANGNFDEDSFALGPLNAGNVVELDLGLPTTSTLIPQLQLFDSAGNLLPDEDGDPLDDKLRVSITSDDEYFARVTNAAWTYGGHRYEVTSRGTWTDLQAQAEARGGYLVSVNDAQERAFIEQAFGSLGEFWLGLSDVDSEGTWVWTDGTADTYTLWGNGEPNSTSHDYAYRWVDGLWYDTQPTSSRFGVIEIPDAGGRPDGMGAGGLAAYALNVSIEDSVPPRVIAGTRLPETGVVTDWVSTFEVDFSERLNASTANTLVYDFATYGGNT
ncbi:MAG: C-type lectin domain-containing protein [Planctomycetota bacterium]